MGDLLDWWRVYAAVLGALVSAAALLFLAEGSRLAGLVAIALVAVGLVGGLLWQAAANRQP